MPPEPPSQPETRPPETRPYVSAKREAAAAKKRQAVIEAAGRLLAEGPAMMSMEAVARAAGVTRLTVYKQFGSRRGLLEAVFDDNAARSGMVRQMLAAMNHPAPCRGLDDVIDVMCGFWGAHPQFARLHDAGASDPEFAEALNERNQRRKWVLGKLLAQMPGDAQARRSALDLIFGVTSMPMFRSLAVDYPPDTVAQMMKKSAHAILTAYGLETAD